jgi:CheY-like chemotaxis protein
LKSFSSIVRDFNFLNNGEYKITETTGYPTYNIKRKSYSSSSPLITTNANDTRNAQHDKQSSSSIFENLDTNYYINSKEKDLFSHKKNNNNKKIILVDDEQDILFTYRAFLKDYNYEVTSFTDPSIALNYIRDHGNFNDLLLVILDIRMKNLNGFQLHQQIKSIDPTIKILFITALDILDELLSIVPGLSKEQIMRKPIDKKEFTNTVKKLIN